MLYQLYETQRALMAPFSEFASASAKLYNHPLSPFTHTPLAQRVSASFDLLHRLAKDYEKPAFNITTARVGSVEVAVQEQVAIDKPFCRLLRFKRFTDDESVLAQMKMWLWCSRLPCAPSVLPARSSRSTGAPGSSALYGSITTGSSSYSTITASTPSAAA